MNQCVSNKKTAKIAVKYGDAGKLSQAAKTIPFDLIFNDRFTRFTPEFDFASLPQEALVNRSVRWSYPSKFNSKRA